MKIYTQEQLIDKLHKMPKDKIIDILFESLEILSRYNGRNIKGSICEAMGYEHGESGWTKVKPKS